MRSNRRKVLGFEIWNRQKDYAICLEIIKFLENNEIKKKA